MSLHPQPIPPAEFPGLCLRWEPTAPAGWSAPCTECALYQVVGGVKEYDLHLDWQRFFVGVSPYSLSATATSRRTSS